MALCVDSFPSMSYGSSVAPFDSIVENFSSLHISDSIPSSSDVRLIDVSTNSTPKKKKSKKRSSGNKSPDSQKQSRWVPYRPTFYLDGDENKPIRAAGILPYAMFDGKPKFLVISRKDRYEDFGGKTAYEDLSIDQTILREAYEESNGLFTPSMIYPHLVNPCYIPKCKYLVYFIPISPAWDPKDFGNLEFCENVQRTVEWVPLSVFKHMRHPRLHSSPFPSRLFNLR